MLGVMGTTYSMSSTLETSHPPMSWLNEVAPSNVWLYVMHPAAIQRHTRNIREAYKSQVSKSASVSGESVTPQSGSRRDVWREAVGAVRAARGKHGRDGHYSE